MAHIMVFFKTEGDESIVLGSKSTHWLLFIIFVLKRLCQAFLQGVKDPSFFQTLAFSKSVMTF